MTYVAVALFFIALVAVIRQVRELNTHIALLRKDVDAMQLDLNSVLIDATWLRAEVRAIRKERGTL